MGYPTHIDPGSKHIRIHREGCSFVTAQRNRKGTTWFQVFETIDDAKRYAQARNYATHLCKFCFRSHLPVGP